MSMATMRKELPNRINPDQERFILAISSVLHNAALENTDGGTNKQEFLVAACMERDGDELTVRFSNMDSGEEVVAFMSEQGYKSWGNCVITGNIDDYRIAGTLGHGSYTFSVLTLNGNTEVETFADMDETLGIIAEISPEIIEEVDKEYGIKLEPATKH